MHQVSLGGSRKPGNILLLGAHCDDIEIGCGASILRLKEEYPDLRWYWVVFSSGNVRRQEAQESANAFLSGLNNRTIAIENFRNGRFPYDGAEIKEYFESLKQKISPDIIFTHYRNDLHQDHRTVSELTWNTFRDHFILEYEIMKYDGDLGRPNLFMPASLEHMNRKIDDLFRFYVSQHDKQWFTRDTFQSLMRLRGIECNSATGFAEAFFCRKLAV